jgi:hypothetical protein
MIERKLHGLTLITVNVVTLPGNAACRLCH